MIRSMPRKYLAGNVSGGKGGQNMTAHATSQTRSSKLVPDPGDKQLMLITTQQWTQKEGTQLAGHVGNFGRCHILAPKKGNVRTLRQNLLAAFMIYRTAVVTRRLSHIKRGKLDVLRCSQQTCGDENVLPCLCSPRPERWCLLHKQTHIHDAGTWVALPW